MCPTGLVQRGPASTRGFQRRRLRKRAEQEISTASKRCVTGSLAGSVQARDCFVEGTRVGYAPDTRRRPSLPALVQALGVFACLASCDRIEGCLGRVAIPSECIQHPPLEGVVAIAAQPDAILAGDGALTRRGHASRTAAVIVDAVARTTPKHSEGDQAQYVRHLGATTPGYAFHRIALAAVRGAAAAAST